MAEIKVTDTPAPKEDGVAILGGDPLVGKSNFLYEWRTNAYAWFGEIKNVVPLGKNQWQGEIRNNHGEHRFLRFQLFDQDIPPNQYILQIIEFSPGDGACQVWVGGNPQITPQPNGRQFTVSTEYDSTEITEKFKFGCVVTLP